MFQFVMGESNGTVAQKEEGRFEITLNRPTDAHNLRDTDKDRAYLHFNVTAEGSSHQVSYS